MNAIFCRILQLFLFTCCCLTVSVVANANNDEECEEVFGEGTDNAPNYCEVFTDANMPKCCVIIEPNEQTNSRQLPGYLQRFVDIDNLTHEIVVNYTKFLLEGDHDSVLIPLASPYGGVVDADVIDFDIFADFACLNSTSVKEAFAKTIEGSRHHWIPLMTISYARYDKNMATGKPNNKCNNLICWNTLFLSADFDAHTHNQGTTKKVTFIIQRGDVSDVDGITNERIYYNHTILAAVNLDLTTSENTFKTSTNTLVGVMCPLKPHRWETLKLTHKLNELDQEQFTYAYIPFRITGPKLSVFDQQLTISDAGSSKALEHGTPLKWPEECSISVTLKFDPKYRILLQPKAS